MADGFNSNGPIDFEEISILSPPYSQLVKVSNQGSQQSSCSSACQTELPKQAQFKDREKASTFNKTDSRVPRRPIPTLVPITPGYMTKKFDMKEKSVTCNKLGKAPSEIPSRPSSSILRSSVSKEFRPRESGPTQCDGNKSISHIFDDMFKKVFKCPVTNCSFATTLISKFHIHLVGKHPNYKPYKCSVCDHRTNRRSDISKHIKKIGLKDEQHSTGRVVMAAEESEESFWQYRKFLTLIKVTDGKNNPNIKKTTENHQNREKVQNSCKKRQKTAEKTKISSSCGGNTLTANQSQETSSERKRPYEYIANGSEQTSDAKRALKNPKAITPAKGVSREKIKESKTEFGGSRVKSLEATAANSPNSKMPNLTEGGFSKKGPRILQKCDKIFHEEYDLAIKEKLAIKRRKKSSDLRAALQSELSDAFNDSKDSPTTENLEKNKLRNSADHQVKDLPNVRGASAEATFGVSNGLPPGPSTPNSSNENSKKSKPRIALSTETSYNKTNNTKLLKPSKSKGTESIPRQNEKNIKPSSKLDGTSSATPKTKKMPKPVPNLEKISSVPLIKIAMPKPTLELADTSSTKALLLKSLTDTNKNDEQEIANPSAVHDELNGKCAEKIDPRTKIGNLMENENIEKHTGVTEARSNTASQGRQKNSPNTGTEVTPPEGIPMKKVKTVKNIDRSNESVIPKRKWNDALENSSSSLAIYFKQENHPQITRSVDRISDEENPVKKKMKTCQVDPQSDQITATEPKIETSNEAIVPVNREPVDDTDIIINAPNGEAESEKATSLHKSQTLKTLDAVERSGPTTPTIKSEPKPPIRRNLFGTTCATRKNQKGLQGKPAIKKTKNFIPMVQQEMFICKRCEFRHKDRQTVVEHIKACVINAEHNREETSHVSNLMPYQGFRCRICPSGFRTLEELQDHESCHEPESIQ